MKHRNKHTHTYTHTHRPIKSKMIAAKSQTTYEKINLKIKQCFTRTDDMRLKKYSISIHPLNSNISQLLKAIVTWSWCTEAQWFTHSACYIESCDHRTFHFWSQADVAKFNQNNVQFSGMEMFVILGTVCILCFNGRACEMCVGVLANIHPSFWVCVHGWVSRQRSSFNAAHMADC